MWFPQPPPGTLNLTAAFTFSTLCLETVTPPPASSVPLHLYATQALLTSPQPRTSRFPWLPTQVKDLPLPFFAGFIFPCSIYQYLVH